MKGIRPKLLVVICVIAGFFGAACPDGGRDKTSVRGERTVRDDLGNNVELPGEVTRAVSLAPNLTEIIFAVGAGDRLVGVTSFCNYPEQADGIQKVGDTLKPNIESIIALRPQVVFVTTASQLESFSKILRDQGIKVFVTNPDSVEGVYSGIRKIGEIMNEGEAAAVLISRLDLRLRNAAEDAGDSGESKRVFVQIDKSLFTIGKRSFISDALSMIGYKSVTDEIDNPYPKISQEKARTLEPDLIVLSESAGNDRPSDVFRSSPAVRMGRVYGIDADILSRPGPRFVDALEQLVKKERAWKMAGKQDE